MIIFLLFSNFWGSIHDAAYLSSRLLCTHLCETHQPVSLPVLAASPGLEACGWHGDHDVCQAFPPVFGHLTVEWCALSSWVDKRCVLEPGGLRSSPSCMQSHARVYGRMGGEGLQRGARGAPEGPRGTQRDPEGVPNGRGRLLSSPLFRLSRRPPLMCSSGRLPVGLPLWRTTKRGQPAPLTVSFLGTRALQG